MQEHTAVDMIVESAKSHIRRSSIILDAIWDEGDCRTRYLQARFIPFDLDKASHIEYCEAIAFEIEAEVICECIDTALAYANCESIVEGRSCYKLADHVSNLKRRWPDQAITMIVPYAILCLLKNHVCFEAAFKSSDSTRPVEDVGRYCGARVLLNRYAQENVPALFCRLGWLRLTYERMVIRRLTQNDPYSLLPTVGFATDLTHAIDYSCISTIVVRF